MRETFYYCHLFGRDGRIGRGCAEQSDRLEPPGRRSGCWLTSPFLFSGIVVGRFGATMELGRSMMTPAAGERSEVRGHRQQIGKSAALTVGSLALARAALRRPRH